MALVVARLEPTGTLAVDRRCDRHGHGSSPRRLDLPSALFSARRRRTTSGGGDRLACALGWCRCCRGCPSSAPLLLILSLFRWFTGLGTKGNPSCRGFPPWKRRAWPPFCFFFFFGLITCFSQVPTPNLLMSLNSSRNVLQLTPLITLRKSTKQIERRF